MNSTASPPNNPSDPFHRVLHVAAPIPSSICGYRVQSRLDGKLIMSLIAEREKPDEILSNTPVTAT